MIIPPEGALHLHVEGKYVSKDLSILKNSVPDYINNNLPIKSKIKSMSKANIEDGGDGAFYIYLKKFKE